MTELLPKIVLERSAEAGLWSLGEDDRRQVNGWIEALRHADEDPFVREHTTPLPTLPQHYMFKTADWLIFFQRTADEIVVFSIHHPDALRTFEAAARAAS